MKRPRWLSPADERGIVRDYVCTGLSLGQIATKWGISVHRLTNIRKRHGVHRYQTRKLKSANGAIRLDAQPEPTIFRCPHCGGRSSDPEGHSACIARQRPAA